MTITPMRPITCIDWLEVEWMRVELEKPWGRSGGLRFRLGTKPAVKNANFDARKRNGPDSMPYFPGAPIMYPSNEPAIVGTKSATFLMPASMERKIYVRNRDKNLVAIPDPNGHAAFTAFGFFMAPLTDDYADLVGFTISTEKERLAQFWGGFKHPKHDGNMMPPMARIGPPNMPHVKVTPLDNQQQPFMIDGEVLSIRPRDFFDFDNPTMYEAFEEQQAVPEELRGFTADEILAIREIVKSRGKAAKAS